MSRLDSSRRHLDGFPSKPRAFSSFFGISRLHSAQDLRALLPAMNSGAVHAIGGDADGFHAESAVNLSSRREWGRDDVDFRICSRRWKIRPETTRSSPMPSPQRVAITFGATTDRGKVRGNNEDHFLLARLCKSMHVCKTSLPESGKSPFAEEEGYLIVVADGMGGAAAGERASALAIESVESFVQNTLKWFLHLSGRDEQTLLDELRQSLERADRTIIERARNNPRSTGWGRP